jgi:hypothetical protein
MSGGWWWLGDGREEMSFKRVSDGWLFVVPFRWPRISYVVNDTQKAELARRLRWIYRVNLITTVLSVWLLTTMTDSTKSIWLAIAVLSAASIVLTTIAIRMAMRSIVSGLTPVRRSISRQEAIVTQARTLSYSAIATMIVASLILFSGVVGMSVASGWSDSIALLGVILFGACSVYFPILWIVKTRTESA